MLAYEYIILQIGQLRKGGKMSFLKGKKSKENVIINPKNETKKKIQPTFKIVKIGKQVWMAENLNVDHYRNGHLIPQVQDEWDTLHTGAWCYYKNDPATGKEYGKLYNWYAVNDPRGLSPAGWHIPTIKEWQTLLDYLGGFSIAGDKMKERVTSHWDSPNTGATNESGFSALLGGYRYYNGLFSYMGDVAGFWSSSRSGIRTAWSLDLSYNYSAVYRYYCRWRYGFSVRCVRD